MAATRTAREVVELYNLVDGRITEVWNVGYQQGIWN